MNSLLPPFRTTVFAVSLLLVVVARADDRREPRPNPNENFPNNPNVNPAPGQKYNAPGMANSHGGSSDDRSPLERKTREAISTSWERVEQENKIARLAAERATDPEVRAHAQARLKDVERLEGEFSQFGQRRQVSVPIGVSDHPFEQIAGKRGADFDRAYLDYLVDNAKEAVGALERVVKSSDPEAREFALRQLGEARQHLQNVEALQRKVRRR